MVRAGSLSALLFVLFLSLPASGQVVINEVLYDTPGSDEGTFTEIAGPPGTSLDGYELVGVNGNGGADYATVDLTGTSIGPSGFFVVAEDMMVPNTDLIDPLVDWQNGPDQVQLRSGGLVVDSLCYGTSPDLTCEGSPATDVSNGTSLTRDAASTDTDDNSADFLEEPNPTPGGPFVGTCDGPTGLTCDSNCSTNDVTLGWTNNAAYTSIDILLDGAPLATLAGTDVSYVDLGRASGIYEYTVVGNCGGGASASVACSLTHCLGSADPDLLITEVVDGTLAGGRPRWVELTNCGDDDIDLSLYSIGNFNNGSFNLGGGSSTALVGVLPPGGSFIWEYDTDVDTRFEEVYGFPPDQFAGGTFINGDDVIAIFFGPASTDGMGVLTGELIDVFGELGVDGSGEAWEYTDSYARRNPNGSQSATFDPDAWSYGGPNALEGSDGSTEDDEIALMQALTFPGAHTCVGAASCDPVTLLDCASDCGTNDVTLTWMNNDNYDSIDVLLDGVALASLSGTDTSYVDMGRAAGNYTYTVVVNCTGLNDSTACSISHCPPPVSTDLIIAEIVDGTLAGGRPRWVELSNCGNDTIDLSFYSLGNFNNGSLELGGGSSSFLSGSVGPGEQFIYEYDSAANSRFEEVYGFPSDQQAGGGFINGNDVVALFFGGASTDGMGVLTGTIVDVYGVVGQDGVDENWEYTDSYARRNPDSAQTDVFDESQWFFAGIDALEGQDPMGEDDEIMLLQDLTEPGVHECGGGGGMDILRGDCDGDGGFNGLLDGLAALNFQFVGGSAVPPCLDQCDFNDDNTFNGLVDGLGFLSFQFVPGSPPPAPPGIMCGADPSGLFDCATVTCP